MFNQFYPSGPFLSLLGTVDKETRPLMFSVGIEKEHGAEIGEMQIDLKVDSSEKLRIL